MQDQAQTIHLTLQMALPLHLNPENRSRSELRERPWLPTHKFTLLGQQRRLVCEAATYCLQKFAPHEDSLWWETTNKQGESVKRITGALRLVIKLREVAPLRDPDLPAVVKDGIHHKVADLLRSFAQRKLDPAFAQKTSYPTIGEGFPIVWQGGFRFLEQKETGKFFLYVPLFARGRHEEGLVENFNPAKGLMLRDFKSGASVTLGRIRGGLLLPLRFDKWGEATFMRSLENPPRWKATQRAYDQRWIQELKHTKDFRPKRVELFMRKGRVFVNIACQVQCKPPVETENFMGVAFGLEHLLTIVVINSEEEILYQRQAPATQYQNTVFKQIEDLREGHKGPFFKILEAFHYERVQEVIAEALRFRAMLAVETVGNVPKGKYSPRWNLRLSYWPTGKLADMIGYKAQIAGLPTPYQVYSATVKGLCSSCGASNKDGAQQIALEGPAYYCGNCNTKGNSGFNAALNLARRARELHQKGVVAR